MYSLPYLIDKTLSVIFPEKCAFCGQGGGIICPSCMAGLMSERCLGGNSIEGIDGSYSGFIYHKPMTKKLIHRMKRDRNRALFYTAAQLLCEELKYNADYVWADFVTHLPRDPVKKRIMGLDQSQQLAKAIASITGKPYIDAVKRVEKAEEQKTLNRTERKENMRGVFTSSPVRGKVILVDDVLTTGSSVCAAAEALKKAGAERVYVVTFAR